MANPFAKYAQPSAPAQEAAPAENPFARYTAPAPRPSVAPERLEEINAAPVPQSIEARDERDLTALRSGQVADLPDPEGVFDGLPAEQQEALKAAYAKHPASTPADPMITGGAKGVMYKGKFVPAPADAPLTEGEAAITGGQDYGDVAESGQSALRGAGKGVVNAATNVVETGLAAADVYNDLTGADKTYGIDTSKPLTEKFREAVPELKAEEGDGVEEFFLKAGEIGAGAIGGAGIASKLGKLYKMGKIGRAATTFAGGNLGPALTQDTSDKTLFTGEGSVLDDAFDKTVPALSIDSNGTTSENILKKRFNLAEEAILTGAATGAVGAGISKGLKWAWDKTLGDIVGFTSLEARQKQATLNFMRKLTNIDPDAQLTPAEEKEIFDAFLQQFDEKTRFKIMSGDPNLPDVDAVRTTARTAKEAGITPEAHTQISDIEGALRAGSTGPLDKSDAQYGDILDEGTTKFIAEEGGTDLHNVERARETMVEEAEHAVAPARAATKEAEQRAEGAVQAQEMNITEDPILGERISKVSDGSAGETLGARGETVKKIAKGTEEGLKALDEGLEARTAAIPDGLGMNNPDEIIAKAKELHANGQISNDLMKKISDASTKGPAGLNAIDYKKLTVAIKRLKMEKDKAYLPGGDLNKADQLRELDNLIKTNTPDQPEIAEWSRYYEEEWAPFAREGKTGEFRQIGKDKTIRRTDKEVGQKKAVEGALDEEAYTEQTRRLLDRGADQGPTQAGLVDEAMTNDIVAEVEKHVLKGGKLADVTPEMLTPALQKRIAQIRRTNPDIETGVNSLFDKLRTGRQEIKETAEGAKTAATEQLAKEREIFGDKLKPFFEGGDAGSPYRAKENPIEIFDKIVSEGDTNMLNRVVDHIEASGSEEAKKGLRAAWMRKYQDMIFSKGTKAEKGASKGGFASDRPSVNVVGVSEFTKDSPMYKSAQRIFKDQPELLDYIQGLSEETSKNMRNISRTGLGVDEGLKSEKEAMGKAKNLLITMTLGVLNPVATRARNLSTAALESMNPEDKLRRYLETIMADSEEFSRMAKKYMKEDARAISPEMKEYIRKTAIKAGIRTAVGEDKDFDKTQEVSKEYGKIQADKKKKKALGSKPE